MRHKTENNFNFFITVNVNILQHKNPVVGQRVNAKRKFVHPYCTKSTVDKLMDYTYRM
jgi:hypothetical protein